MITTQQLNGHLLDCKTKYCEYSDTEYMPLKMEDRDIVPCVEVKIEIAHRASLRAKPTKEGFTHDWTVYVRGQEDCNISQFVEKVVFHLHHTFANPRRVVKVPPYYVSEVGYAGFNLPIEIFFKSKTEPRKIMFNYDLFLQMYEPVSFVRCEKLTFQKPTDEFKETLINAGGVLVLPPGETQSADLCGPPAKTESPKKQKQPLTSKENVSKQMLNFSGNEKTSNSGKDSSASLKSSVKQERIDNNSKDHDADLSRRSNSSSKMVSNPAPLPSQKRPSDSPIHSENKQKKARRSSSMSSERFRSEDKQKYEEKENKDKVKRKGNENKDESHSEYKDGKDCHKMDTSKQKSSKNSKEKKKESNLMKDGKKEAKDDKREVRDDKKELMNDKKELKKDIKDDKKDVKDDYKVKNDTKEVKDGKRKVQNDKNESINKTEVKNDQKKVKQDKIKIINDRKDVKDDRKGYKEVKENKKEVKEVKDGKQEVIAKTSSKTSERRKQDDKCKVEIKVNIDKEKKSSGCEHSSSKSLSKGENDMKEKSSNKNKKSEITTDAKKARSEHRKRPGSPLSALDGSSAKNRQDSVKHLSKVTSVELKENLSHQSKTSNQIYYKSALQKLMDELEDISSNDEDDFTATVIFSQQKSSSTKSVSEKESSNISDTRKKTQNWIQPLTQSPDPITKSKEAKSTSTGDSIFDVKSQNKTAVKDLVVKTKSSTECEHSSSKPSSKGDNDKENISNRIIQSETKKAKSEHRSGSPVSAVDGSMAKTWDNNVKHLSKVTSEELIEDLFLSSDSSSESDDDFGGESSGSDLDLDISPTASTNKNSNPISSKSPLQILMDELKNILSDDGDISATKTVVKDLDMKQKPNEDKIKDTKKANTKENNFVTSNISSSEQAPNGEELIQLSELKKILMGITDLSVLQKAVKLILSTGYFEIKDTFDSDLLALNLNAISQLQSFVATKL